MEEQREPGEKNYTGAIPGQHRGESVTAESTRAFGDPDLAVQCFDEARQRLLDVNRWKDWAGESLAHFMLADAAGNSKSGFAEKGDLIRIDIPGPGSKEAGGYDWVEIEEVKDFQSGEVYSIGVRVRPVPAPESSEGAPTHFYDKHSTSTFTVTLEGTQLTAAVYDRNIAPNTEPDSLIDKVRDAITGFFGEKALSKVQWKAMTDGLLE